MNLLFGVFSKIGSIFSGFSKKKTTIERLEQLDKEIKEYEKFKQRNEYNEKKYLGGLILYSIIFYVVGAIVYYIYFMPKNLIDRLKTLIPFLITPLLVYLVRKFLKWVYIKRTINYEKKLIDLKEEKKNILEEVKENETYKKAREILERFSAGCDISVTPPTSPSSSTNNTSLNPTTPFGNKTQQIIDSSNTSVMNSHRNLTNTSNNLIQRNPRVIQNQHNILQQSVLMTKGKTNTPNIGETNRTQNLPKVEKRLSNLSTIQSVESKQSNQNQSYMNQQQEQIQPSLPPPPSAMSISQPRTLLPRPIINPNRSWFDKLLDYVIGEGPNNRYALICKSCQFHNGMAIKEEFEYIAFRCAYCLFYNEARKTKLCVPRLINIHQSNSITSNNANEATNLNENNNNHNNDSTLSSSNSFDAMESEPISSGSCSNPQATSSKSYKLDSDENNMQQITNGIGQRKSSLSSALTESAKHNLLNVRNTSKSMTNIVDKNRNEEDKENESADEIFNNSEIETS